MFGVKDTTTHCRHSFKPKNWTDYLPSLHLKPSFCLVCYLSSPDPPFQFPSPFSRVLQCFITYWHFLSARAHKSLPYAHAVYFFISCSLYSSIPTNTRSLNHIFVLEFCFSLLRQSAVPAHTIWPAVNPSSHSHFPFLLLLIPLWQTAALE